MGLWSSIQHGWNAFVNNRSPTVYRQDFGPGYSYRPDRPRLSSGNERSIVAAIINRIAMDAAAIDIKHCRIDDDDQFSEVIKSKLNDCLTIEANIDQTARAFKQDVYHSLMDEGCIAIVPVDTTLNSKSGSYDILSMRVGKVIEWFPKHVRVLLYNENTGNKEEIIVSKKVACIIENPLFSVMNEPSSTLKRLIRKLNLLDYIDEQSGSGKLDLIIQLPYIIKTEARREQAEERRKLIETQLKDSKYGIAYTDGTERITQLNRPVENNLLKQIEYLATMLYSQLGITQGVLDGTADEKTMLNYTNRTIEPMVSAVVDEMKRKFLSKIARSKKQSIMFFRAPFKLVPAADLAELADKLTRNEIVTSNEMRQFIGMKPSKDPKANQLLNSNISHPDGAPIIPEGMTTNPEGTPDVSNDPLNNLGVTPSEIDELLSILEEGEKKSK